MIFRFLSTPFPHPLFYEITRGGSTFLDQFGTTAYVTEPENAGLPEASMVHGTLSTVATAGFNPEPALPAAICTVDVVDRPLPPSDRFPAGIDCGPATKLPLACAVTCQAELESTVTGVLVPKLLVPALTLPKANALAVNACVGTTVNVTPPLPLVAAKAMAPALMHIAVAINEIKSNLFILFTSPKSLLWQNCIRKGRAQSLIGQAVAPRNIKRCA